MATGTLPCLQAIHIGVACPDARRSYQRTGGWPGTYWSNLLLPQSAPTCTSEWRGCTSPGDLEGFFSVDPSQVLLLQRAAGRCHLRPRSGLGFVSTVVCFSRTGRFAYISLVAGMSLSPISAIFCTAPMVGETKISTRWGPTDHPIIRGARHRFHVRWKVLKICQREVLEPFALSGWPPARDVECLWRDTTMSITGAGAPMSLHGEAHVENDAHHILWPLRFHQTPLPQTGSIAPGLVQCNEDRLYTGAH